jgi:ferredoxin-NADP reductase
MTLGSIQNAGSTVNRISRDVEPPWQNLLVREVTHWTSPTYHLELHRFQGWNVNFDQGHYRSVLSNAPRNSSVRATE